MKNDRKEIVGIISQMLDNPDPSGIYPTATAYTMLEHYVEQVRMEALGWMHAECCCRLDRGEDPRTQEVPKLIEAARMDLDAVRS